MFKTKKVLSVHPPNNHKSSASGTVATAVGCRKYWAALLFPSKVRKVIYKIKQKPISLKEIKEKLSLNQLTGREEEKLSLL